MATEKCPKCNGSGKQECGECGNQPSRRISCTECKGTGKINCATCDGKGWVQSTASQPRP
ncbi:MAG: hypothetical protein PHR82_07085 [Endomicrobiaceae bacterium]|nr:hypothetical protein [Endomicrobiaceae bacterium]